MLSLQASMLLEIWYPKNSPYLWCNPRGVRAHITADITAEHDCAHRYEIDMLIMVQIQY